MINVIYVISDHLDDLSCHLVSSQVVIQCSLKIINEFIGFSQLHNGRMSMLLQSLIVTMSVINCHRISLSVSG